MESTSKLTFAQARLVYKRANFEQATSHEFLFKTPSSISFRLVEEADYKNTADLFASKKGDDKTIDNFIPKSENDYLEYAELISNKLRPYEKSFHYIGLLKHVMRLSMTSLKAADAKEVASSVTAIANEKLKAEKEAAAGKKKTGGKKKQLLVDKPDDEAVVNAGYDGYDDYDFM